MKRLMLTSALGALIAVPAAAQETIIVDTPPPGPSAGDMIMVQQDENGDAGDLPEPNQGVTPGPMPGADGPATGTPPERVIDEDTLPLPGEDGPASGMPPDPVVDLDNMNNGREENLSVGEETGDIDERPVVDEAPADAGAQATQEEIPPLQAEEISDPDEVQLIDVTPEDLQNLKVYSILGTEVGQLVEVLTMPDNDESVRAIVIEADGRRVMLSDLQFDIQRGAVPDGDGEGLRIELNIAPRMLVAIPEYEGPGTGGDTMGGGAEGD